VTVTVGILLGVVLSWIDPPSWVTPVRLAVILVLAAAGDSVSSTSSRRFRW
jgi:hypothetical protein